MLFHFFSSSILFSVIQQRSITHPGADARVVSGCKTEIRSLIPGAVLQQPVAQFSYGVLVHLYLNCWDSKIYSASKPTGLKYCLLKVEYICANTCQFDQMCLQMVCKNNEPRILRSFSKIHLAKTIAMLVKDGHYHRLPMVNWYR